jgi:hypothetical protein
MFRRFSASACLLGLALLTPLPAQEVDKIRNWSAPPFWTPHKVAKPDDSVSTAEPMEVDGGPIPMPFVATVPCRVVDTRNAPGAYGGPAIVGGAAARTFNIPGGPCPIPPGAGAYSVNVAAILPAADGFLTVFPTGFSQPLASDLNFLGGEVIANALIVPAGTGGAISVFANVTTNLIIDINGYYQFGALDSFYVNEGQASSVSSLMIADGAIVNADISASAAIADTKLATIATAGKVADTALSSNVSKLGPTIETAEIADNAVTALKIANVVRGVSIPLPAFHDCQTASGAALDFTSGADAIADYVGDGAVDGTSSFIRFDSGGPPDQDSEICSNLSIPPDYAAGGHLKVRLAKGGLVETGGTEILTCGAGLDGSGPAAPAGTVAIPAGVTTSLTCVPTFASALAPGRALGFYLSITSNGVMDQNVVILSVAFEYAATQ